MKNDSFSDHCSYMKNVQLFILFPTVQFLMKFENIKFSLTVVVGLGVRDAPRTPACVQFFNIICTSFGTYSRLINCYTIPIRRPTNYRNRPQRTETNRNGPKRTETDPFQTTGTILKGPKVFIFQLRRPQ